MVENLLFILPVMHKKIFKIDPSGIGMDVHLSRLHIGILGIIHHETLTISEIARKFLIPKPQMTFLVNQLTSAGMIEKQSNKDDRRIIDITLTEKGRDVLNQCDRYLKNNLKELLSYLNEEEQAELFQSLQKLRKIGLKWENQERYKAEANG